MPFGGEAPAVSVGRCESEGVQWRQAILLGTLIDLFIAPAFGFPIMSGGSRFGLFFAALAVGAVVCALAVKVLRRNRGAQVFADRVELVAGARRSVVPFAELRRIGFEPRTRKLSLESTGGEHTLRLSPAEGAQVVRSVAERLPKGTG